MFASANAHTIQPSNHQDGHATGEPLRSNHEDGHATGEPLQIIINMKTIPYKHVLNVPFAHGEISVVLADTAEDMMRHSTTFATEVSKLGVGVMLMNCGLSERRFNEHTRNIPKYKSYEELPRRQKPPVIAFNSTRGDLISDSYIIDSMAFHANIGVVIIMGWEWIASTYARKERLMYYLRELIGDKNIAVIVYSQARTKPVAGRPDRAGIGKLAMLAYGIVSIDSVRETAKVAPSPAPVVMTAEQIQEIEKAEVLEPEKMKQLVYNKNNELQAKPRANPQPDVPQDKPYPLNDDDDIWAEKELVAASEGGG